jgi:4-amino-4-deoxy-L-arabinose transferase-like glycosyltransferase
VEPHTPAKPSRFDPIAIVAISVVTLLVGLGGLALIGPDEPRYAEVAREMFASGDYISTRLCGCLWFEKPALLYWCSAACYHLFGVGEFAARLPSAIAALVTVVGLYFWLREVTSHWIATASSIVLATSGLFIAYARVAAPDMLLTFSMTLSLAAVFQVSNGRQAAKLKYWVLFGLGLALAMLSKGLVGLAIVPIIAGSYALIRRDSKWITVRGLLWTVLVFVVVAGIWYVPVTVRYGSQFLIEFFGKHHFRRYVSNVYGHPQPFYFFFVVCILGITPWSLFLIPAAMRLKRLRPRLNQSDSLLLFAWLWLAVPLVFFSFSGSKLPGYILPVIPAVAIIAGTEIGEFCTGHRTPSISIAAWGTAALTVGLAAAFIVFASRESAPSGWRILLTCSPIVFGLAAIASLLFKKGQAFSLSIAVSVASIVIGAVILTFGSLNKQISLKPLSLEIAGALRPNERICFFIKKEFAPVFYDEGRVVCGSGDMDVLNALREDILERALEGEQRRGSDSVIVITTENWRRGLENYPRFETHLIARQESPALRFAFARRDTEAALAFRVSLKY